MAQRQRKNRDRHARPGWFVPVGILLLALALRMIWVRDPGCPYDIPFFVRWMRLAAQHGVAQAFTVARSSYPPLWAALLYALCPGGIYLSVWWAQIDAWFVLPMLLGVWWLSQRRIALAWAALGLAVGLKLQATILLPVFLVGTTYWAAT